MFRDRKHAGELLAKLLAGYRGSTDAVILALPRGGVPVAAVIARTLALPLDVFLVHKIGAPSEPELAVGAVAADGLIVLDEKAIAMMHISQTALDAIIAREREEFVRRERLYRGDQPPLALEGQIVILVDDGLATGYTMLAAVRSVRRQRPARVVVAVPVALRETLDWVGAEADEAVCVYTPSRLEAVGQFYEDFGQVSDYQVKEQLEQSRRA
ncbi:phosphoribosyltransferase family protein [Edaphobacter paludis]|uniref:Phosphoribosyltransferase family protein n=1 Tax=Edaphobacter paludis TaxID=3035702 RepID=A0AAU7CXW4_9BACT